MGSSRTPPQTQPLNRYALGVSDTPLRTAILGGGALGLTVALRLAQRGERAVVFEREPVSGGLAAGFQPSPELPGGGPYLEKFYHHIFRSDTRIIALIEALGLGSHLGWSSPVNSVLVGGRRWQPYTPLGLLSFAPLPFVDRIRMGAALAALKLVRNGRVFERETAHEWLQRWMGRRAYEVMWKPLLTAKFGSRYDQISMAWFWARIFCRSFDLGYLHGGFQLLYDALVAEITRLGGEVRLGHTVSAVAYEDGAWCVRSRAGGTPEAPATSESEAPTSGEAQETHEQFARVVSTLPTRLTARLIPQLPANWRAKYDWGEAYGAHCLVLALDRQLLKDGAYWVNVNDPGYPFLVLVEHTNYIPASEYGGRHLIYLGNYLSMEHPLLTRPKEEILAEFLPALRRIAPDFRDEWVTDSWSFSAPYAQPIVTREYPQHIPPFRAPLPDLWIGSMFQVYPQDRGQNYSIALGERLVAEMLDSPSQS
jgi:protoporphyrinogen oxidase